ncbi:hypothetical protein T03_6763 [Trichinella britovi]|uniref:Uncharacterized protein n=1 Tax=Trichinella britovi TaxID=45882 RepID=A0A0V1CCB6_TRIBR|nr:hypothetical protein T03_6763 [Trichinella britovi]
MNKGPQCGPTFHRVLLLVVDRATLLGRQCTKDVVHLTAAVNSPRGQLAAWSSHRDYL